MPVRAGLAALTSSLALPQFALAAGDQHVMPIWLAAPFVLFLVALALLPLLTPNFWECNRRKALVAAILAAPVVVYLWYINDVTKGESLATLHEKVQEYVAFILMLGSLYVVTGGMRLSGELEGKPRTNALFLLVGAVIANVIGTTGASMLLIRPILQVNRHRRITSHIPVFFIFIVSNLGGCLTPLGDPPLFLGFLNGVHFSWPLRLWPHWLVANGMVLFIFFVWDTWAYHREPAAALQEDKEWAGPLRAQGLANVVFLAGIVGAVLLQSPSLARVIQEELGQLFPCPPLRLNDLQGAAVMAGMALGSWLCTSSELRRANGFKWGAITEVAVVFAGIFVTMVPALLLLRHHGGALGLTQPWQYFWLSGALSSFLDNAPTYLTFATLAAGENDFSWLARHHPTVLEAISCGAVFMGANTYIGNGPNFMVKAIAEEAGYRTPSFFGYMLYAGAILLPTYVVVTLLFFSA